MPLRDKDLYLNEIEDLVRNLLSGGGLAYAPVTGRLAYDPELLYVECHVCGKPVLWEKGKTTELLLSAGVPLDNLDERCMIISEGCPVCTPLEREGYTLAVVRIAGLTPEEAAHMSRPGGTA